MTPKRECSVCGQEWATTYELYVGPVCRGCKGHLTAAQMILVLNTGMCHPSSQDTLWFRQMQRMGEILVTNN